MIGQNGEREEEGKGKRGVSGIGRFVGGREGGRRENVQHGAGSMAWSWRLRKMVRGPAGLRSDPCGGMGAGRERERESERKKFRDDPAGRLLRTPATA